MMVRFRITSRSRLIRSPNYEVETKAGPLEDWAPVGLLRGARLVRLLDKLGLHPTDSTEAISWAFDAYKGGDVRWVYPVVGPLSEPPGPMAP